MFTMIWYVAVNLRLHFLSFICFVVYNLWDQDDQLALVGRMKLCLFRYEISSEISSIEKGC